MKLIWPLRIAIVVLLLSNAVITFIWIFQCWPVQAVWDNSIKDFKCLSHSRMVQLVFAQAMFSVISDFGLAIYPIFILWNNSMSWKDKIGVWVLMGLGVM